MGAVKFNAKTSSGLFCDFSVYIDGEKVGKVKRNSSKIFKISKGEHVFQIKDSGALSKSLEYEFVANDGNMISYNISCNGFKYTVDVDGSNQMTLDDNKMILFSGLTPELSELISSVEDIGENVLIAIKGVYREYLICTNKNVYIVKKGFMTGHFFGKDNFHIPYNQITNVEIDMHLLYGYFELSAGGLENKRLNYWSSNENEYPAKQPNCISLNKVVLENFEKARDFILNYEAEIKNTEVVKSEKSIPEQIREYKQLLDDEIISKDEFEQKKKELLEVNKV